MQPHGLTLPSIHYTAARRISKQLIRDDRGITAPELAVCLQEQITTTRKATDLAQLIGACCAQHAHWRRAVK